jgi:hypothetical protein
MPASKLGERDTEMKLKVYNKSPKSMDLIPHDAVYVGRPTVWGNPFTIGKDGTRSEVLERYEGYLRYNPGLIKKIKKELKGKHLVCWCAPKSCHADILLRIANE